MAVGITFVRPDVTDNSDAISYGEQVERAPEAEVVRDAVATNQPCRIAVEVDGGDSRRSTTSHHSHYRPFERRGDRLVQVVLYHDGVEFFR